MSSTDKTNSNVNNSRKRGVDVLLTTRGKSLKTGESVTFRLVKGPPVQKTADPVDPKAAQEYFPLVAKFPESVVKPEFSVNPWKEGRLYQQDIPKPTDDSDEETKEPKKRWKYNRRRHEETKRQWICQEKVDFFETMVAKREKKAVDPNKISTRYEGVPEHNYSRYSLFLPMNSTSTTDNGMDIMDTSNGDTNGNDTNVDTLQVCLLPASHGVVNFAQPASRQTLSLTQAEQVIEDQRAGVRTIQPRDRDPDGAAQPTTLLRFSRAKPVNNSKNRLLSKLKAKVSAGSNPDEEDGDDVMGDLAFRKGKSGRSARKELLTGLGDGVKVSDDGVIGGTDDAAFGGRQRFGNFQSDKMTGDDNDGGNGDDGDGGGKDDGNPGGGGGGGAKQERGADGAAMADDFYSRDVQAEYEELDYDANEQFDDDDVDLGETEVAVDTGGYGDEDDDDDFDELDLDADVVAGAEGLASVAGFKLMLAKARGEVQPQPTAEEAAAAAEKDKETDGKRAASPNSAPEKEEKEDTMSKLINYAAKSKAAAEEKAVIQKSMKADAAASQVQVDENGLRIINLASVRREIWLHHGSISTKRLMKIFEVKKKSGADRQKKFSEVVKELCTMKTDPIGGRMLVLKQHYSNM
jgi:hypothetical protein